MLTKESLSTLIGIWGNLEDVATGVVFLGVAGEFVAELTKLIKNDLWKRRTVVISTLAVLSGIAGELVCQHRLSNFNEQLIAGIELEAKTAIESAAQADARAAAANENALQAALDLAKFKAPRVLSMDQLKSITDAVRQYPGIPYDFSISPGQEESDLTEQIATALENGGWHRQAFQGWPVVTTSSGFVSGMVFTTGTYIEIAISRSDEWTPAVQALGLGLTGVGMKTNLLRNNVRSPSAVHILVGAK